MNSNKKYKEQVRKEHITYWRAAPRNRHGKHSINKPSPKKVEELGTVAK